VIGFGAQVALAIGEPNNTFAMAAVVNGPQLVVDRIDFVTEAPDTTLVVLDPSGAATATDDDSSFFGTGRASALLGAPVNSDGSIRLSVSSAGDFDFDGLDDTALTPHGEGVSPKVLASDLHAGRRPAQTQERGRSQTGVPPAAQMAAEVFPAEAVSVDPGQCVGFGDLCVGCAS
jgi:hypothetical protein